MIINGGNPVVFEVEPIGDGLYTVRTRDNSRSFHTQLILTGESARRRW